MKHWMVLIMGLTLGWDAPYAAGQDPAPAPVVTATSAGPTGSVKQNRVNVRGRATLSSEVITQLNQGDRVTILEEITLKDPKPDEPAKWVRIALPSAVPVWVHGGFIDPATKTVKADRLNIRGGPGENYSVLGQLEQGTLVRELETQNAWIKIEPPGQAHAFIAAHLVSIDSDTPPPVVAAATPTSPAAPPPAPGDTPAEIPVETVPDDPPAVVTLDPAAPVETEVTEGTPPAVPELPGDAPPPIAEEAPPVEPIKRIVRREGIVRRSVSIQAPTYFVLESLANRKTINYLHSTNVVLQDYYGARIAVTGEELLDERWPNTPVIKIESLEAVP